MSGERRPEPLDVDLILRRDTGEGPEVLLSRRAGAVYAAGLWHLPSGRVDGPEEDVVPALVGETGEKTGVGVDLVDVQADGHLPADVRKQDPSGAFAYLREEVHDRLMQAQALLPGGMAPHALHPCGSRPGHRADVQPGSGHARADHRALSTGDRAPTRNWRQCTPPVNSWSCLARGASWFPNSPREGGRGPVMAPPLLRAVPSSPLWACATPFIADVNTPDATRSEEV